MKTDILASAIELSDQDLLARLHSLAGREREATVELVAHLAALDGRPSVYAAQGYGSLFGYCTQALRLSEDAACNRIEAARACRRFPLVLELLASGAMSLTSVRLLGRHLTVENHVAVLARASGRSRQEIERLVAELAPRADVPTSVRRLPSVERAALSSAPLASASLPGVQPTPAIARASLAFGSPARPVVRATSPERYRVQFTIGPDTHDKLRRLQVLLRREIPDGDPATIFDRAVTLLLQRVEKTKLAAVAETPLRRSIRPRTDKVHKPSTVSRYIPREVKRAVWRRDDGRCAFESSSGRRCPEQTFLEFHHVEPYAYQGPSTVANISLRCRRHNQYEAELIFGRRTPSSVSRESPHPVVGGTR